MFQGGEIIYIMDALRVCIPYLRYLIKVYKFMSKEFIERLKRAGIQISMDGRNNE